MSGLSVTEVMARNRPHPGSPNFYGPGFLFYLKHYLLEETDQTLSQVRLQKSNFTVAHELKRHFLSPEENKMLLKYIK